jgi:endonuclease III
MSSSTATTRYSKSCSERLVVRACDALVEEYGLPRHGNPRDPLGDLIYILLSNRSTAALADQVYKQLRKRYPRWERLLQDDISEVRDILRRLGLHNLRARQLRAILRSVQARFGACSLDALRELPSQEAQAYLESLPGVSTKVAKCVQMYTLRARVLPVDVHVFRVSRRLGLISKTRPALSHDALETVVPPRLRYRYHVTCVALGRDVCRATPNCGACCLRRMCPSKVSGE